LYERKVANEFLSKLIMELDWKPKEVNRFYGIGETPRQELYFSIFDGV